MALADSTNPLRGVSGPGPFAKREDLAFQPDSYGQGVEMKALKSKVPLSKAPTVPGSERTTIDVPPQPIKPVGLFDRSQWPDVPVTDGIDGWAGRGSEAAGVQPTGKISESLAVLLPYDTTGEITILYQNALSRGQ